MPDLYRANPLKRKLAAGRKCLGAWASLGNAAVAEIFALCGYDFVILDREHGTGTLQELTNELRALKGTDCVGVLRVPSHEPSLMKPVLDAGVESIMVPNVETAEQARALVAACRYPPAGFRGAAYTAARASGYGLQAADYAAGVNDNLVLMLQIESALGVANIAEIAAVEGVDLLFLGPADLSGNLGHLGDAAHPEVARRIAAYEKGCRAAGRTMGTVPHAGRDCQALFEAGYALCAGTVDVLLLRDGARAEVARHRERNA